MRYTTIYDAASFTAFLNLALVVPGILAISVAVYSLQRPGSVRGLPAPAVRWVLLPFAVLWTTISAGVLGGGSARAAYWVRTGQCTVLEGTVQDFRPEPASGHGYESFTVERVPVRYSGSVVTAGFHFPGPIYQGLPVRICYRAGEILRLEVAQIQH